MALHCDPNNVKQIAAIQRHLSGAFLLVNKYRWIVDAYLSDYFVHKHGERVHPSWWDVLQKMEPPELALLLKPGAYSTKHVWPLSLLAFKKCTDSYSLPRQAVELENVLFTQPQENSSSKDAQEVKIGNVSDGKSEKNIKDGQYLLLQHCYRRHVKPKKQHEITNLGKALCSVCEACRTKRVVDVGAGQGHLSRLLAFGYGLDVTTVEAADCHAPKAQKFDREVHKDIRKGIVGKKFQKKKNKKKTNQGQEEEEKGVCPTFQVNEPCHLVARIDPNVGVDEFLKQISHARNSKNHSISRNTLQSEPLSETAENEAVRSVSSGVTDIIKMDNMSNQPQNSPENEPIGCCQPVAENETTEDGVMLVHSCPGNDRIDKIMSANTRVEDQDSCRFVLTGLHACGDLSPTMLRVFVQCPSAVGLASVTCCYMKLSTKHANGSLQDATEQGYPMSQYVMNIPDHHLSFEAREMACHFVDTYHDRLEENSENLIAHCYRAALQEIIHQKDPSLIHGCIKLTLKKTHLMPFEQYAARALRKLGLEVSLTSEQRDAVSVRLGQWKDVVAFYTLRLTLAPVVEAIILLDRVLYLAEKGMKSCLIPLFDPKLSPRNFVLISTKEASNNLHIPK